MCFAEIFPSLNIVKVFVLSYAANGELEWYIEHYHCLSKECVQFYTAELVLALEYLSECDLVHRYKQNYKYLAANVLVKINCLTVLF